LGAKKELTLKAVNGYLMKKLNLKEKPAKTKGDVINVWDRYLPQLQAPESA